MTRNTRAIKIQNLIQIHWPYLILTSLITLFWIWGLRWIPFHPDETSWLFMSRDFEVWITQPWALKWQPENSGELDQNYREINAPLTKYILGLGERLSDSTVPDVDWNWSLSWEDNLINGGLPSQAALIAGRMAITLLLPLTLTFIYLSGFHLGGRLAGLCALLVIGFHPLALLHARRAMAEGPLLFGTSLALYGILQGYRRPWIAGLGVALAFNAKQSTLPFIIVGLVSVLWHPQENRSRWLDAFSRMAYFIITFLVVTLLLNPLYWSGPVKVLQTAWKSRAVFTQQQITAFETKAPEQVIHSPIQRGAVLLANLFLRPPQFAEIGNYLTQTAPAERDYLEIAAHRLGQGLIGGGVALCVTLLGVAIAIIRLRYVSRVAKRNLVLLLMATVVEISGLVMAVPLPFQRYALPLLPLIALWIGYAVSDFVRLGKQVWHNHQHQLEE